MDRRYITSRRPKGYELARGLARIALKSKGFLRLNVAFRQVAVEITTDYIWTDVQRRSFTLTLPRHMPSIQLRHGRLLSARLNLLFGSD